MAGKGEDGKSVTSMVSAAPSSISPSTGGLHKQLSSLVTGDHLNLKEQKLQYKEDKKRLEKLFLNREAILEGLLKMRTGLKTWIKFWCKLYPGMLMYFKETKRDEWVGTILLAGGQVLHRPSSKEGYCFKFAHPLRHAIHAQKGPHGETWYNLNILPSDYCILRAATEEEGIKWISCIQNALENDPTLIQKHTKQNDNNDDAVQTSNSLLLPPQPAPASFFPSTTMIDDDDEEGEDEEFDVPNDVLPSDGDDDIPTSPPPPLPSSSGDIVAVSSSSSGIVGVGNVNGGSGSGSIVESQWVTGIEEALSENTEETTGSAVEGEAGGIVWALIKQVRQGVELSKISFPAYILEPRSLLDKFSDSFYHCDFLNDAARMKSAEERFLQVIRYFLSGFYKKPKGIKKPYNPLLGEIFRCCFITPSTSSSPESKCFLIAEQVSHHPPISALYASNRQAGWVFYGQALCKSKFYGNSAAAAFTASFHIVFPEYEETYNLSSPDYSVRGLLWGSTLTEYTGPVIIECQKSGYTCELQFKPKPTIGGQANLIEAKIKRGDEKRFTLRGRWDENVTIQEAGSKEEKLFLAITPQLKKNRLQRLVIPMSQQLPYLQTPQGHFDSEITWDKTSRGIRANNVLEANEHKEYLEETQRNKAKVLKDRGEAFNHKLFYHDGQEWKYKYGNFSKWNAEIDIREYEYDGVVSTITKQQLATTASASTSAPRSRLVSTSSIKIPKQTTEKQVPTDQKRETVKVRTESTTTTTTATAERVTSSKKAEVVVAEIDPKIQQQITENTSQIQSLSSQLATIQQMNENLTKEISHLKWRIDGVENKAIAAAATAKPQMFLIFLLVLIQAYLMIFGN